MKMLVFNPPSSGGVGGGGATIGDAVSGGTANRVLFTDASGNLADSANLTYTSASSLLKITAGAATDIPLVVQNAASHATSSMEFRDSVGTRLMSFDFTLSSFRIIGETTGQYLNLKNGAVTVRQGSTNYLELNGSQAKLRGGGDEFTVASNSVYMGANSSSLGSTLFAWSGVYANRIITIKTASFSLSGAVNSLFTNEGATALVPFTLPTAVAGLTYTFYVQDADGISITAGAGDTIRIDSLVTATAGTVTSTAIGSSVTLVAINATEWVAIAFTGTWS